MINILKKIALRARFKTGGPKLYKSYTRQACNFVFPHISQRINGESRPRPGSFRISEREALNIVEGREKLKVQKGTEKVMNVAKYQKVLASFISGFDNYLSKIDNKDRSNKYTIINDLKVFKSKYGADFSKFHKKEKKKSGLYEAMYKSSGKMTNIIFNIMNSPGPVLVYSNYVLMEGLSIFKMYLKYFGFYNFMNEKKIIKGKIGFVEFHGGISDRTERYRGMAAFNKSENKYGEYIKIILISPAGSEGLNLKNVRQVHIMEPYWNEVRIEQIIARAVRYCSHVDLKMDDRHVDVYRYKSVRRKDGAKWTTDQIIEDLARSKDSLIQSFLEALKEVAVDCELNKTHNMMGQKYKCFKFNEPSLFDKYVGPSYKADIYDDMRIDNGLNSTNSMVLRVKVRKVKAVMQTSKPEEEVKTYSKPKYYWFRDESNVVYDKDLHYAVGKVRIR